MVKTKLSFQSIQVQVSSQESVYVTIFGVLTILLYFSIILYAYFSSWYKGKIGWNDFMGNKDKYNLISTALRWVDKRVIYGILTLFFIFSNILFYYKGFFKKFDTRIIVPVSSFIMLISIVLLTHIIPERFVLHNSIALIMMITGISIGIYANYEYSNFFRDEDIVSMNEVTVILFMVVVIALGIGFFNIYNNYLSPKHLFPKYNPFIRNMLGIAEITAYILVGIILAIMVSYKPLPGSD